MSAPERLVTALACLDQALASRPRIDGDAFTGATTALCSYRDALLQARRENASVVERSTLVKLNSAITLILANHYPIGGIPWDELKTARAWVEDLARSSTQAEPRIGT
jgi:glutathione S-transferase